MRSILFLMAGSALLAGCASGVPESNPDLSRGQVNIGQGVGFGGYEAYEAERLARERALRGMDQPAAPVVPTASATGGGAAPVISSEELSRAGLPTGQSAVLPAAEPVATEPLSGSSFGDQGPGSAAPSQTVAAAPAVSASVPANNPGISDEQSFAAVKARESIESDAERLARQRAAYQVIQPEAVPERSGAERPNIVQYALSTTNRLGQPVYTRGGLFQERRFRTACLKYPSSDLAQEAFLASGGPQTDKLGVDPDGDGFACAWDPAPFRAAKG